MSSLDEIRKVRLEKLTKLTKHFGNAYPVSSKRTHSVSELVNSFSKLKKGKKMLSTAGRVRGIRSHGGSTFIDLEDAENLIQCYLKKDELAGSLYDKFVELIDVGDFINVSGRLFITKKKEQSLLLADWSPLSKSLRPLPEKWQGIRDAEERFRKRPLDLLMNKETRERFRLRREIIGKIREFLELNRFEEVETPILQPLYGGALANPFVTHYSALKQDFYLRIAPELYLKRLLVGNMPRVYEIGKNFRNEGIDVSHSPEFTELEGYMAYEDLDSLKSFIEKIIVYLVKNVLKTRSIDYDEKVIQIKAPFRSYTFDDAIKRYALIPDLDSISDRDLKKFVIRLGVNTEGIFMRGKLLDEVFKKAVRKHLIQPTFITHHPIDISPLAKASPGDTSKAERLQLIIGGVELANAYSELNDPIEQRKRFLNQEEMLKKGDEEVSRLDEDYIDIMEYGMPPIAGFGIGIDRLVQMLTNTHNIREVILFPTLKSKKRNE